MNAATQTAYTSGQKSVTVSSSVSGRTVKATASNGATSSGSVALGTGKGSLTFTLTPSGNNTTTKAMAAGYYNAGTITANGATAYATGAKTKDVTKVSWSGDTGASSWTTIKEFSFSEFASVVLQVHNKKNVAYAYGRILKNNSTELVKKESKDEIYLNIGAYASGSGNIQIQVKSEDGINCPYAYWAVYR